MSCVKDRRVVLTAGTIRVEEDGGLLRARGLPYGKAERYVAPGPVPRWPGVRDATQRGPVCPQLLSRLNWVTGPVVDDLSVGENCLVVSVTAPADADRLPVMVWFHGGAYMSGSGESPKYDPDSLAREGRVVVVNVSYRLGIFGYLTPDGPGSDDNLGLRDQILALQWVRDNIGAFGGDPSNVTAFGQSAGADSILSLMLCDEADGLFRRAIAQSAPLGLRDGRDSMTNAMRSAAADALGAAAPTDAAVEQLLEAQTAAVAAAQRFGLLGGLPFAPIQGRPPLPAAGDVSRRIAAVAARVELLVGYTRADAAPFVEMMRRAAAVKRLGPPGSMAMRVISAAVTKRVFGGPAHRLAETWRANGGRAATYRFDWAPAGAPLGACHCIELPLLMGTPSSWLGAPMLGPEQNPIDQRVARMLRGTWAAFAHQGIATLSAPSLIFN